MGAQKKEQKDIFYARTACDAELASSNRYFALDQTDLTNGWYLNKLPQNLADSTLAFHERFYKYIENNCCKIAVLGCDRTDSFQILMRKNQDSIIYFKDYKYPRK
jgi:hypothetical protein